MNKAVYTFMIFLSFNIFIFSQETDSTSVKEESNPTIYAFGYFFTGFNFPFFHNDQKFSQKGFLYSSFYKLGNMGTIEFSQHVKLEFLTQGNFKIGFSQGSTSLIDSITQMNDNKFKYYVGTIDFFSLFITPQLTISLSQNVGLTASCAANLLNIGATAAFLDKGQIKDDTFGSINIVPFCLFPEIAVNFGKASLGIGYLINPYDIVDYRLGGKSILSKDDQGLKISESTIKRSSIMFTMRFQ